MNSIIVDIHTLRHVIELCPLLPGLLLILVRPQTISVCSVLPTLHSPQIPWGGFQEPALEQFVVLKYESIIKPSFHLLINSIRSKSQKITLFELFSM